jgi:hypothetical protein
MGTKRRNTHQDMAKKADAKELRIRKRAGSSGLGS